MINSTWRKSPRYEFTAYVQHCSAINTSLKQEGWPEQYSDRRFVWSGGGSVCSWKWFSKVRLIRYHRVYSPTNAVPDYALSLCLFHSPTNAVYIKRSHPSFTKRYRYVHFSFSILSTLRGLDNLPTYCTSPPLPHRSYWSPCKSI